MRKLVTVSVMCAGLSACSVSNQSSSSLQSLRVQALAAEKTAVNAAERSIVNCMKKQGFRYLPEKRKSQGLVAEYLESHSVGEFRRLYGYGVFTSAQVSRNLQVTQLDPGRSKNEEYFGSLSETDQTKYNEAFIGAGGRKGCTSLASQTPQVLKAGLIGAKYRAKLDKYSAEMTRLKQVRSWIKCMQKSGWQFDSPLSILGFLNSKTETISVAEGTALELKIAADDVRCSNTKN